MIILVLLDFYLNFYRKNNGIKKEKADRDAESMVFGGKLVKDGDYAILQSEDEVKYYVRQSDRWRLDRDLTGKDPNKITFCNYKPTCIEVKQECKSVDNARDAVEKNLMDEITKRFSEELNENILELKSRFEKDFDYRLSNLSDLKFLLTKKLLKKGY